MPNKFRELELLLARTSQEYRRGLHEIIGAPAGDSPAALCDHLGFLRAGAAGKVPVHSDYKQLVTDIADKVHLDWASLIGRGEWAALSSEQIEAAIVGHVDADEIYVEETQSQRADDIGALDDAFSSLSSDWRKLLAGIIYIHQVIRPAAKAAEPEPAISSVEPTPELEAPPPSAPASAPAAEAPPITEDATERAAAEEPIPEPARKSGDEPFHAHSRNLGQALRDFWRWSASDLVSAATRDLVAEYIVACALGLGDGVRREHRACDILLAGLKIEVESAAGLPSSLRQEAAPIRLPIRPTRAWDTAPAVDLKRRANIYVFCLLRAPDGSTLDPLDVAQWSFYVVPSSVLDAKFPLGKSIGLASLEALGVVPMSYEELSAGIRKYVPAAAGKG
jgi:hypothetical protein